MLRDAGCGAVRECLKDLNALAKSEVTLGRNARPWPLENMMETVITWGIATATLVIVLGYEVALAFAQHRQPERLARTARARLREDWFAAVSPQTESEILAVQTLRYSVMSATMTASTAVLGLTGALTLAAPSLHASFGHGASGWPNFTPPLAMELTVIALPIVSLVSSVMAVRYYNHARFVGGMPVASESSCRGAAAGTACMRKAGVLYS